MKLRRKNEPITPLIEQQDMIARGRKEILSIRKFFKL